VDSFNYFVFINRVQLYDQVRFIANIHAESLPNTTNKEPEQLHESLKSRNCSGFFSL